MKILSRRKYDASNEVRYLTKCQGHENIVKLYDVLQDDLHTYIIMELLTGGELFERLRQREQFNEKEAATIMKSLISAIQFIHSQGIVHRDLKPENIIFSDHATQAKVKIIDFGFARLKPDQAALKQVNNPRLDNSKTTPMMQTPCFTLNFGAPEVLYQALCVTNNEASTPAPTDNTLAQSSSSTITTNNQHVQQKQTSKTSLNLAGYSNGYDESCDLWSLGVILYTMLCGRVPFSGDYSEETLSSEDDDQQKDESTNDDDNDESLSSSKKRKKLNDQTAKPTNTITTPSRHLVTQEKIIERIRNASSSLDFKEKRWQNVSDSAKQLLRGLLNVDPKKRMKLKDLSRHEWIKSGGQSKASQLTALVTPTPSQTSDSSSTSSSSFSTATCTAVSHDTSIVNKFVETNLMNTQFSLALSAFHTAEQKGLFTIQLKDVFEAPLAQRRHHKRSTSSNASSESSVSTISICSSLSTSTTNNTINTTSTVLNSNTTPTKKCPLSCGKLTEQTVFNFSESYVSDYLKQQKNSNNLVFNRPITRSFTHHTNKFNTSFASTTCSKTSAAVAGVDSVPNDNMIPPSKPTQTISNNSSSSSSSVFTFQFEPTHSDLLNQSSSIYDTSTSSSVNTSLLNGKTSHDDSSDHTSMNPPLSKRLKRVSTILIDD